MLRKISIEIMTDNPLYVDTNKHEVQDSTYFIYKINYRCITYIGVTIDPYKRYQNHKSDFKTEQQFSTTLYKSLKAVDFEASQGDKEIEFTILLVAHGGEYAKACENYFMDYFKSVNKVKNYTTYKHKIQLQRG